MEHLRDWFKKSFLELNVGKTKELMCGKSWAGSTPKAIYFSQQEAEIVLSSTFTENVDFIYKKAHKKKREKKSSQET